MKLEQKILLFAGILVIGAFFLPYLKLEKSFLIFEVNAQVSGLSLTQSILDEAGVIEHKKGKVVSKLIREFLTNGDTWKDQSTALGLLVVFAGPILFLLHGLGYIFRGFSGRQYKRGIFFSILYSAASWGILKWISESNTAKLLGQEIEVINLSFFEMVGPGYWVAIAGMLIAAISLFFEPKQRA
ncbi:hypothetical protein [Pontibacter sp. G13]|uniref:hypothetical protein n=1 Tax=Pontibacter sp. G13 TaxID=3074898 RepID=UPI0028893146|nr:hypothetical protein [Pontibacter sp. G13]WNJ18547.1 hypothetical protein RJD25_27140 [Pontibacter sp. G13]